MRTRRLTNKHDSGFHGINATPLIDVVMCLIIFFLIVGKMSGDKGVAVRLPEARSGQEEASPAIMVVTIAKSLASGANGWGTLGISVQADGDAMPDAKTLESAVRGRLSDQPLTSIQVRADRELNFGMVEPVLRAAGQGGARSVRLAAEKPS